MTIKVGDQLPDVKLYYVPYEPNSPANACGIPVPFDLHKELAGKKAVIFSIPGAFTPTCTASHVPGYVKDYDALKAKGVDVIICYSVIDAFVMSAFGKVSEVEDKIIMAGDGNGELTQALGLELDLSAKGLGKLRSQRFALIVDNLKVTYVGVEKGPEVSVSGSEEVLKNL